ncbi:MAG: TetR/AcrR family transcriptional regulator [Thermaerobacter sp.]|nr:TetR/AcrR family transcriptional regulator [Thermaerobacter sp.]
MAKMPTIASSRQSSKWEGGQPTRRLEVLQKAVKIIYERGYRDATISQLASEMGFSKAAFYHYVRSKQDLLYIIFDSVMDLLQDTIQGIIQSGADPAVKLRHIVTNYIAMIVEYREMLEIYFTEKKELSSEQQEAITAREREFMHVIRDVYQEGIAAGIFVDVNARVVTNVILGMCGWIYRWYDPARSISPEQLPEMVLKILAHGIELAGELEPQV